MEKEDYVPSHSGGYVAGGDLDYNKRPKPRMRSIRQEKSLCVAYITYFIGGWLALHHLYLRRDRQAFIWWCTMGGYFGFGLFRDMFFLPSYVRDVNEYPQYIEELTKQMQKYHKPPLRLVRFAGQILVGNSWSFLTFAAVPSEPILGINLLFLVHLAPLAAALAVWTIGNIGREQGGLKWAVIGAYTVLPFTFIHPPAGNFSSVVSAILFNWKGKEWRRTPYPRKGFCRRISTLIGCWMLFVGLWSSYLYFNAEITDKQGETVKVRDALKHFFNSPMFLEFKANLWKISEDIKANGFKQAWLNFVELIDPHGEHHALKVLGLPKGASEKEITSRYRQLAREWHPDRHKTDQKAVAEEKFVQIQAAYEKLSNIKVRRSRKNKISDEEENE